MTPAATLDELRAALEKANRRADYYYAALSEQVTLGASIADERDELRASLARATAERDEAHVAIERLAVSRDETADAWREEAGRLRTALDRARVYAAMWKRDAKARRTVRVCIERAELREARDDADALARAAEALADAWEAQTSRNIDDSVAGAYLDCAEGLRELLASRARP